MYPTRAELVAASNNAQLKALNAAQQDGLYNAAIVAVESYTGQKFVPIGTEEAPATKLLHGDGTRELYLPARLEQLTAISVPDGSIDLADVAISEDGDRLYVERHGASTWVERALSERREQVFPRGRDMVTVTGIWGWADCPDPVVLALRLDMEAAASAGSSELAPSLEAWRKLGMDSMSQGSLSVQLDGRPNILSPTAAVVLDEAELVWTGIGAVV